MVSKIEQRVRDTSRALEDAYNEFHAAPSGSIKACDSAIIRLFDIVSDLISIVSDTTKR